MPASDASVQFSRTPTPFPYTIAVNAASGGDVTGTSRYAPFTPQVGGTVGSISAIFAAGFTGNCKMTIFADASGSPGAILGSATTVSNPVLGGNTFTFGTPVAVSKGTQYWFGISHDVTANPNVGSGTGGKTSSAIAYGAFPSASPTVSNGTPVAGTVFITPSTNADFVNEPQQDGVTSYVYDSTPGDADFYNIGTIASMPASTIAVTTRGYMQKSDAGSRTAAVQLKSGATTVASPTLTLTTSGWLWAWRMDLTDPNTSAAWTAAAVNAATIGPVVVT
jgi:hypothetical protein